MCEGKIKEVKTVSCQSSILFQSAVNELIANGYELKHSKICEVKDYETSNIAWSAILQK